MKRTMTLALALFRFLDEQRIAYCVVGDSRGYPDHIHSDIDIVVEQGALPGLAARILAFCSAHDVQLVQCLQHEQNAHYFVLSWPDENGRAVYLIPDICGDYYRKGTRFLSAAELLAGRMAAVDDDGKAKEFFVAAPAMEFIYYLLKRIDKQSIDDCHGSHLSAQWRLDPTGAFQQLVRFWDPATEARILARAAEADEWHAVRQALPWLRASMHKRLRFSARARTAEVMRMARRVLCPTGLMVAFIGPDGAGKSSVIDAVIPAVAQAFRQSHMFHLRPRMGVRGGNKPVTDPHGAPQRGQLASITKILYFALDYTAGYFLKVRPLLVRSTLVLFDRYYHDILVDPRRYRYGAPTWLARWIGYLIPKPDLWLLMDAPADLLQARKQEVPAAESARQRDAYLGFVEQYDNAFVLDATQPMDKVVGQAGAVILDYLGHRTTRRVKSSSGAIPNPIGARILLFFSRYRVPLLGRLVRIVFNSDIYCRLGNSVSLPHPYGIIMHSKAVLGERVTVMQQVTIGGKDRGENLAPVIGDDVYIGAGARVLGGIRIGNGAVIGANAVVTRDVPAHSTVVGANRIIERHVVDPDPRDGRRRSHLAPVKLVSVGSVAASDAQIKPLAGKRGDVA